MNGLGWFWWLSLAIFENNAASRAPKKTYFFSWQAGRWDLGDGITLGLALQLWDTEPPALGQPHAWFVPREVWQHLNVPRVCLVHQEGRDVTPLVAEYFQWFTCWAGPDQ